MIGPGDKITVKTNLDKDQNKDMTIKIIEQFSSGTFGIIYKAEDIKTKIIYALKETYIDLKFYQRELNVTVELNPHNFIVKSHAYWLSNDSKQSSKQYLFVLMDRYDSNIADYYRQIQFSNRPNVQLESIDPVCIKCNASHEFEMKLLSYQWLRGLGYMNCLDYANRDVKVYNIVLDYVQRKSVLIDLGSAKKLIKGQKSISYIVSRHYRAPELAIGAEYYNTKIDVFGLACCIAEFDIGRILFNSSSGANHFSTIMQILGCPTQDEIYAMNPQSQIKISQDFQIRYQRQLQNILKTKNPQFIDLMNHMFDYDPERRYSCFQCLCSPWYDEIRQYFKNNKEWQQLFEYNQIEKETIMKDCAQEGLDKLMNQ